VSRKLEVLVVDDDPDLLKLLEIRLRRSGFLVETAASGDEALRTLERVQPDVVVSDLKMAEMDGIQLLGEIEKRFPVLPVILLTAHGTIPDAVTATQKGAFAFLTKPYDDEALVRCIRDAVGLTGTDAVPGGVSHAPTSWRARILTRSPAMESLLQQAELAAGSGASVIIQSASGTGKELLAGAIHAASDRREGPFVPVNCTAIPEALFESELFGHVKGAFTGADRARTGLFQSANGGTLFLDEVGDMPLAFQGKLLRAIQEQSIRPVGSDESLRIDVRILSATHRNLEEAVAARQFREDLYYRLGVITLELPSLAERREDIPLLANHFLKHFADAGEASGFSSEAMELLMAAPWPGNVRQLENVVHQCKVLSRSRLISENLVEHALRSRSRGLTPFAEARDQFELEYLSNLLQITTGNVAQAARLAQRHRSEFYKLLKKHGLEPARFREQHGDTDIGTD